jgi:hypothetical protein
MRIPVLVYVLLYLVVEMIGAQLAAVDWAAITPLMVASAVTHAMLVVSVIVAVLVTADLTKQRWRPLLHTWMHELHRPHTGWWGAHRHQHEDDDYYAEVVGVTSWRPEPLALPMGSPSAAPTATYAPPTYAAGGTPAAAGRPFPEDDGTLL